MGIGIDSVIATSWTPGVAVGYPGAYRTAMPQRCQWVPSDDPRYLAYHDEEWGVTVHDPRHLFEMLTLEGAQAGLSWRTILYKREGYRRAFAGFDFEKVARFTPAKVERLLYQPEAAGSAR
jgi:DNA-3-methyladenine glycosylase I